MSYFVTGATGFIGSELVSLLMKRKGTIYLLVRKGSSKKVRALLDDLGAANSKRFVTITGDITRKNCGLRPAKVSELKGKVKHFFHLAAIYDLLEADTELQRLANVEGTRHAMELATAIDSGIFHHMSSVAAAGLFRGRWREDMFEEAAPSEHPYFKSKHAAEGLVRNSCTIPYRIYRPGAVVGHSKTGVIDKVDGPYFVFPFLQKIRKALPPWFPLVGIEGGQINIVPVDYVVEAMDYLAHKRGLDGRCFHLTDPNPLRAGEVLNTFCEAASAPRFAMRIDSRMLEMIPVGIRSGLLGLPPVKRITDGILKDLSIPPELMSYVRYPTKFDCKQTLEALKGSGIECPSLSSYAGVLWDYWERNMDPNLLRDHTLKGAVKGKTVLITGASSGIGRAVALKVAAAGATTLLVARGPEKLKEVQEEIERTGGICQVYRADLADEDSCDALVKKVLKDHSHVDVLVNNAGRSIRRSVIHSVDRFHDYKRTMQLNYFGAVKMVLGFLPEMLSNGGGHVVNVSSIGVLSNSPRFSAYVASKAALDAFSRCVRAELLHKDVNFTTINMPLVRTPMIGPTGFYSHVPALTPDEASDMVCEAIIEKPRRIATNLGIFAQVMNTLLPNATDIILNTAFKIFPDSDPSDRKALKDGESAEAPSAEAVIFASIMRGVYW